MVFSYLFLVAIILYLPSQYLDYTHKFLSIFLLLIAFTYATKKHQGGKWLLLTIILSLFILGDFVTKRMAFWYFHQIPLEIISICLDTNLNEIKSALHFESKEKILISYIVFNSFLFLYLLVLGNKNTKKTSVDHASIYFLVFSLFFFGIFPPIKSATLEVIKGLPEIRSNYQNILLRKDFKWGGVDLAKGESSTVILFLGETHRGDHLQINGYWRDTTPNLMQENVISFKDAIAQSSYTLGSTPMILTRKNVMTRGVFPEKSIISAYKEAGYETWYVSYLSPTHIGDNEINLIANEADHYVLSNVEVSTLKKILKSNAKKKLIVYKTIGAHFLYHERYPASFNFFKPSYTDQKFTIPGPTNRDKELLINSYDNAIRYSLDTQVSNFISELKNLKENAYLCFISDHGTAIYEDDKTLYAGGLRQNYNIAFFFWFNEAYSKSEKHRLYINTLKKHVDSRVSSEYLVDTMLELSDISVEKKKGFSLLNKQLPPKKRLVIDGNQIVDYDKLPIFRVEKDIFK